MPTYVLGTGLSHDGSTCLLRDGRIAIAIEKERLTRRKHDGFNDAATVRYCLDAEGIGFDEIALVVENNMSNRFELRDQQRRRGRNIPASIPRVNISHHLAHAYSAYGTAPNPCNGMTVVVMDGRGSSLDNCTDVREDCLPPEVRRLDRSEAAGWWERESVYSVVAGQLVSVFKDFAPLRSLAEPGFNHPMAPPTLAHGVGEFYGGVTRYIFGDDFAQGKVMGLAPYGRQHQYRAKALSVEKGRAFVQHEAFESFSRLGTGQAVGFAAGFQRFADIASWAQGETEAATRALFHRYQALAGGRQAAFAGGLALNAVINGKLLADGAFNEIYFQPAAGDNGIAIGCAYFGWLVTLGQAHVRHDGGTAFGRQYSEDEVCRALRPHLNELDVYRPPSIVAATAKALAGGSVVGWFQAGCEFGPRALGHRSILADPRRKEMRDHINRNIKRREEFRPFAPAVALGDADRFFEIGAESPYMIVVHKVHEAYRETLSAVVHRDGSARVQTVTSRSDARFYALLEAFGRDTGVPMLLNTSFNGRDMPIVERPADAVAFFRESALDVLSIGDLMVTKRRSPRSARLDTWVGC